MFCPASCATRKDFPTASRDAITTARKNLLRNLKFSESNMTAESCFVSRSAAKDGRTDSSETVCDLDAQRSVVACEVWWSHCNGRGKTNEFGDEQHAQRTYIADLRNGM